MIEHLSCLTSIQSKFKVDRQKIKNVILMCQATLHFSYAYFSGFFQSFSKSEADSQRL